MRSAGIFEATMRKEEIKIETTGRKGREMS
jgi:hypothetical protein